MLGDVVGYGHEPNECCDLIRSLNCLCVAGNHDYALAGKLDYKWFFSTEAIKAIRETRKTISIENLNWLESLPLQQKINGTELVHSSLADPLRWPYLALEVNGESGPYQDVSHCFERMSGSTCFVGHTHTPTIFLEKENETIEVIRPDTYEYELESRRVIVDVGSVGKPRLLGNQGSFAIFSSKSRTVQYTFFPLD